MGVLMVRQERADTHKKIKSFFSQFKKTKNFEQIRVKLAVQKEKAERSVRHVLSGDCLRCETQAGGRARRGWT